VSNELVLERICKELVAAHKMHTILLYGSRADGSASEDSDYDVAAFGPIKEPFRIARLVNGAYLDVWAYPEDALLSPTDESLRLRGSRIIMQRDSEADVLLGKLESLYRRGPPPLPTYEVAARKVWAHKMLARIEHADPEGNYRRVWLLQALLESYFHVRGQWFEGPKKSLRWLQQFDLPAYHAFCLALRPGATNQDIASLVQLIAGSPDA